MDGRCRDLTRHLQEYDSRLFAERDRAGTVHVLRRTSVVVACEVAGERLGIVRPSSHRIFSLTHNWSPRGRPVEWGALPILARIREIDSWRADDIMDELEEQERKSAESSARHLQNEAEAFAGDFHSAAKRAFADINTSNLSDPRRKEA